MGGVTAGGRDLHHACVKKPSAVLANRMSDPTLIYLVKMCPAVRHGVYLVDTWAFACTAAILLVNCIPIIVHHTGGSVEAERRVVRSRGKMTEEEYVVMCYEARGPPEDRPPRF